MSAPQVPPTLTDALAAAGVDMNAHSLLDLDAFDDRTLGTRLPFHGDKYTCTIQPRLSYYC